MKFFVEYEERKNEMENRQKAINRIKKYCSVYEDCTICPQYVHDGDKFICKVNRKEIENG